MPKNTNDVIRYMYPITLWSVDDIQDARIRPLEVRGRALGAAAPGLGWEMVVVTGRPHSAYDWR
ncbi:hypothetical protein GCM10027176_05910 [Actinoallomurus bryophytorum]